MLVVVLWYIFYDGDGNGGYPGWCYFEIQKIRFDPTAVMRLDEPGYGP